MKFVVAALAAGAALGTAGAAFADDTIRDTTTTTTSIDDSSVYRDTYGTEKTGYFSRSLGAPRRAFEIGVAGGYSQAFGDLGTGLAVRDVAGPGIGGVLTLAYRAKPGVAIGLSGGYQQLAAANKSLGKDALTRSFAPGVDLALHFTPYSRIDVWGSIGVGYRLLWDVGGVEGPAAGPASVGGARPRAARAAATDSTTVLRHGFQLAKVQLGFDVRLTRDVAIGPVIGADVSTLLWRDENRGAGSEMMSDRGLSTFIFGGLQGHFDIGGERIDEWTASLASR